MRDCFELLGLPRRALLDESELQAAWHQKSREAHPDHPGGSATLAAEVNAAYETLLAPEKRLKHLLELHEVPWRTIPISAEIMRNLIKMYELARASSIVPVPVTVPSIRVDTGGENPDAAAWVAEHIQRRHRLNGRIADYAERKGLRHVDLFTATAEPGSLMLAEPYSNDGLHLTTSGYRLFGRLVYEQLFSANPAASGEASPNPSRP